YTAERYRLTGELMLRSPVGALPVAPASPEACIFKAIEIARQQHAKSFELRAAMSLARLWYRHGKAAQAHHMLADAYSWFTEGFDTHDLQKAKVLLHTFAQ